MPFHIDLEKEGFDIPHIGYFFYVKLLDENQIINIQKSEIHNAKWFSKEEIASLSTFDQTKALVKFAIDNFPKNS
jgi:NADH pyrophosphatase NudC (nudix superfamily)